MKKNITCDYKVQSSSLKKKKIIFSIHLIYLLLVYYFIQQQQEVRNVNSDINNFCTIVHNCDCTLYLNTS